MTPAPRLLARDVLQLHPIDVFPNLVFGEIKPPFFHRRSTAGFLFLIMSVYVLLQHALHLRLRTLGVGPVLRGVLRGGIQIGVGTGSASSAGRGDALVARAVLLRVVLDTRRRGLAGGGLRGRPCLLPVRRCQCSPRRSCLGVVLDRGRVRGLLSGRQENVVARSSVLPASELGRHAEAGPAVRGLALGLLDWDDVEVRPFLIDCVRDRDAVPTSSVRDSPRAAQTPVRCVAQQGLVHPFGLRQHGAQDYFPRLRQRRVVLLDQLFHVFRPGGVLLQLLELLQQVVAQKNCLQFRLLGYLRRVEVVLLRLQQCPIDHLLHSDVHLAFLLFFLILFSFTFWF
mmetsp:Transcript_8893/g.21685  ORF Transcript_8893/g.21685 Transcript_8893/m.21685 type:complete len:341 (+) Transcript_8893:2592-3614(+)